MREITIRADASPALGSGHIMRCLALAQGWQAQGGKVYFVVHDTLPAALDERLRAEGMQVERYTGQPGSVEDATYLIQKAHGHVVVDGYHFGGAYQRQLKAAGLRVLFIDDNGHADYYEADRVLNQNIHATADLYSVRSSSTTLLLGTRYALLRRSFQAYRQRALPEGSPRHLLITMGGSDTQNVTRQILEYLVTLYPRPDLHITAVIGGSNPHREALEAWVRTAPMSVNLQVDVPDMAGLMAEAELAISAAGSTLWELAFMGIPTLAVITAENQRRIAVTLGHLGAIINLGHAAELDEKTCHQAVHDILTMPDKRNDLIQQGRKLVDGEGVERVIQALTGETLRLRIVTLPDMRCIWEWANDPTTRQASFSSEAIPWEQHQPWFQRQLNDPQVHFFLGVNAEDEPVGQVRLVVEGAEAVISVSVAPDYRGRGYGCSLIDAGTRRLFDTTGVACVNAFIKPTNQASIAAFEKAQYQFVSNTTIQSQTAMHMQRTRN